MIKSLRKFIFIVITVAFLLGSANIPLYMHLAEHQNDAGHDHNKCPICQQAVANKVKAVVPFDLVVFEWPLIIAADVYIVEHIIKGFKFLTLYPRAPPAIS